MSAPRCATERQVRERQRTEDFGEALLPVLGPAPEGAAERSAAIYGAYLQQEGAAEDLRTGSAA